MRTEQPVRIAIDHLREGVQLIDRQWRYVYVNPAAAEHGRSTPERLIGRTMMECYPGIETSDLFRVLTRVMESGRAESHSNAFTYPTGEARWFDLRIDPVPDGICVLSLDVTEERAAIERQRAFRDRAAVQLQQAQKMEALGQLAGSIAHDFNNVLTAILGFSELLLFRTPAGDTRHEDLEEIRKAAESGKHLTKQLLAFARQHPLERKPVQVNDVVRASEGIIRQLLGKRIAFETRLAAGLPQVHADAGQLQQILVNLAVNARDAMPDGGTLFIATREEVRDGDNLIVRGRQIEAGPYVVLDVTDTGTGMPPEIIERLFEPFFTTKAADKGTGLGLSTVYGIVRQSGGYVDVTSEPGAGTTFRIGLPRTDASSAA